MKTDFLCINGRLSTYFTERGELCKSNMKVLCQFKKIEHDIGEAMNIEELKQTYELKILDNKTRLSELKYDQLRVIYFLYIDEVFVYLGTFLKKSGETPKNIIEKNNYRILKYKELHKDGKE